MISYSLYITHFLYILANFPEIGLFGHAGQPDMYSHFQAMPPMPGWYMPLLFFPGAMFWALVSFLLVERPGIKLGRWLANPQRSPILPDYGRRSLQTPRNSSWVSVEMSWNFCCTNIAIGRLQEAS